VNRIFKNYSCCSTDGGWIFYTQETCTKGGENASITKRGTQLLVGKWVVFWEGTYRSFITKDQLACTSLRKRGDKKLEEHRTPLHEKVASTKKKKNKKKNRKEPVGKKRGTDLFFTTENYS